MILVCYETIRDNGWKTFENKNDMEQWLSDNPDKYAAYIFISGPQYNIDTIEQAKFLADCRAYGFAPSDYRRFIRADKNHVLELYGFENDKCLLRDVRNNTTIKMEPEKIRKGMI